MQNISLFFPVQSEYFLNTLEVLHEYSRQQHEEEEKIKTLDWCRMQFQWEERIIGELLLHIIIAAVAMVETVKTVETTILMDERLTKTHSCTYRFQNVSQNAVETAHLALTLAHSHKYWLLFS